MSRMVCIKNSHTHIHRSVSNATNKILVSSRNQKQCHNPPRRRLTEIVVCEYLFDLLGDDISVQLRGHGDQFLDAQGGVWLGQGQQAGGGLPSVWVEARAQTFGLLVLLAALQSQADRLHQRAGVALCRAGRRGGRRLGVHRTFVWGEGVGYRR